jgi:hypothetical protein
MCAAPVERSRFWIESSAAETGIFHRLSGGGCLIGLFEEDTMRSFLRIGLVIFTASLSSAGFSTGLFAEEKLNPAGIWQIRLMIPGRPASESTLRLERSGEKIVGVLSDFRGRSTPIKDAQLKDGELSFHVTFSQQGREFSFAYKGKLTADSFKGKVSGNFGGRPLMFDFDGKRKKEEATLAGAWKITFTLDSGLKLQPTVRLKQEGEKLSGDYIGTSGKELRLQNVQLKGQDLSFRIIDEFEGDKVPLVYSGKVAGATMQGTVALGEGKQTATLKFEAQKIQTPTVNIAGSWKLKVPFKPGPSFEPTLKLVQTGSVFSGTYAGEQGDTAIADALILGDEFTFEVARSRDGKSYKLRYQGKVKGDTIKGSVDYDFDGIIGVLDFEGQRVGGSSSVSEKKS